MIRNIALVAIFCALVGACHELRRIADGATFRGAVVTSAPN